MKKQKWVMQHAPLTGRTHYKREGCPIEIQDTHAAPYRFIVVYQCQPYAAVKTFETARKWANKLRDKLGKEAEV